MDAISAYPGIIQVPQPDGSRIDIMMKGDENGFKIFTSDGFQLLPGDSGFYEYAVFNGEKITTSGIKASNPDRRSPKEIDYLSTCSKPSFIAPQIDTKGDKSRNPYRIRISDFPTIGKQKALVLLVEFNNMVFSTMDNPYDYYTGLLNEEGFTYRNGAEGSARDYFLKCSNGKFSPDFIVSHPVKLSQDYEYYGVDTVEAMDYRVADMVKEACILADDEIDFTEFDADNDGYVDNVYIFYAGFGEADSYYYDAIWPHSAYLEDTWNTQLSLDGIKINRYTCSNEIRFDSAPDFVPVGIGTFVHEFGHVLGLADHYDTYKTSGRIGVDEWDTMASASYHNNQNTPPLYSGFERAELGWLDYIELDPKESSPIYLPVLAETDVAYKINVPNTDEKEYFILENRRQTGWDSTLPGEGLLVWHIDMDDEIWFNNTINVDGSHQRVDIVEADRLENILTYSSDPFPGTMNITQFDFIDWSGSLLFSFDDVKENTDQIRIILGNTDLKPDMPDINVKEIYGTSFCVEWQEIDEADSYTLNVKDKNGLSMPGYSEIKLIGETRVKIEGLSPLTDYFIDIYCNIGNYKSDINTVSVTTSELAFFEIIPDKPYIESVIGNDVILGWKPINDAESYFLEISEINWDTDYEIYLDFDEDISDFPSEWEFSSVKMSQSIFGESSPALKFENDGDYIEFNYSDVKLDYISFYNQTQLSNNLLSIEAFDIDKQEWKTIEVIEGNISGCVSMVELDNYSHVKIIFHKNGGYMIIDDVYLHGYKKSNKSVYDIGKIEVIDTQFKVTNLKDDKEYGAVIIAQSGNQMSLPSEALIFRVNDNADIDKMILTPNGKFDYYDIYGRHVGPAYRGLRIERTPDGYTRKIMSK